VWVVPEDQTEDDRLQLEKLKASLSIQAFSEANEHI
jgi:hypothetical protein